MSYGALSGSLPEISADSLMGLRWVTAFRLASWQAAEPELARHDTADVTAYAAAGRLDIAVQEHVPLANAARAHELLEDRARIGRVLLIP